MWKFGDSTTLVALLSSKVPREDNECKNGSAVLDEAMYGTKDAAQCFNVASENALTGMSFATDTFSSCLHHSSAADMSGFRHGDHFVVPGTRTQPKAGDKRAPADVMTSIELTLTALHIALLLSMYHLKATRGPPPLMLQNVCFSPDVHP